VRLLDLGRGTASTATLLVRLATLWFAVVLGLIAFIIVMRRIGPEPTEASEERTDPRLVPTSDPAR
jgi:hypothetical protein